MKDRKTKGSSFDGVYKGQSPNQRMAVGDLKLEHTGLEDRIPKP